jgi:hypothetical protein
MVCTPEGIEPGHVACMREMNPQGPPNCYKCQFFHTTWERKMPNGCRKFGFKCKQLPSLEVLATSGSHCVFFLSTQSAAEASQASGEPPREGSTFSALG